MEITATAGPALVGANWYRFSPGQQIHHAEVASVSYIWALQGAGLIRCRGESYRLSGTGLLRLPWRHDVDYAADPRTPFHVGTLHLVPSHDRTVPVEPRVAFVGDDPLLRADWRQDPYGPTEPRLFSTTSPAGRHLVTLGSYAIDRFRDTPPPEESLRALGTLLADTDLALRQSGQVAAGRPVALQLMMDHVASHLDRPLTLAEIAAAGRCSPTTAGRLFTRHTGQSAKAWARARQLDEAALLLRTTGLRVSEVARRIGFSDPLYFSRVFKATYGVSPRAYGAGQLRP